MILIKAHIKGHQRRLASGKVVMVRPHEDSRRKKASNDNAPQQLGFDFEGMYDGKELRPGTTQAQTDLGKGAVKDLALSVVGIRSRGKQGISLLGLGICKDFVENGSANLVGQKIGSPADLAALAQVYRDPRFETFRVLYTKGGAVVGEAAYTSRAPGLVAMPNDFHDHVSEDMIRFGASGYWLLHNHPSGRSDPSVSDLRLTERLARMVSGFRGHVVIDHNEYSVIYADGDHETIKDESLNGVDLHGNPVLGHDLLGATPSSPKDVAGLAKELQKRGELGAPVVIITQGGANTVGFIASVPAELMPEQGDAKGAQKARAWLRRVGRKAGSGAHVFIAVSGDTMEKHRSRLIWLVQQGIVTDVVSDTGRSLREEGIGYGHFARGVWDGIKSARRRIVGGEDMQKSLPIPVLTRDHEPTKAQIEAGNYKVKRRRFAGLDVSVENPAGSYRRGQDRAGKTWETRMLYDYGYIRGTLGVDGDHVDCYLGPNEDAPMVYIVHQRRYGDWDKFDEDKCMLGFDSQEDAIAAYLKHYDDPRFLGPVTAMPTAEFREKVMATKNAPQMIKGMALILKAHVRGHTRRLKNGKVIQVKPYDTGRVGRGKAGSGKGQMDMFGGKTKSRTPKGKPSMLPHEYPDAMAEALRRGDKNRHGELAAEVEAHYGADHRRQAEAIAKERATRAAGKLKASDVTFQHIKDMIGNSLGLHEWEVDNGGRVKAQVKTTTRGGVIKTAYLHVTIIQPNGSWTYYREQKNGNFKLVSSGRGERPQQDSLYRQSKAKAGGGGDELQRLKRERDEIGKELDQLGQMTSPSYIEDHGLGRLDVDAIHKKFDYLVERMKKLDEEIKKKGEQPMTKSHRIVAIRRGS